MNTMLVNSAAGVIMAALTQNRTAAGIALALESAQLLQPPETAAELAAYRALELGTPQGRISAKCADPQHPVWLRDLDDVRGCPWCRVAELEAAAYGDATVRLLAPVEQIRHLHACVAAQMSRADTLSRLCREKRDRVAELEAKPAEFERPADEDPIAFSLTDKAKGEYRYCGADLGRVEYPYTCERRIGHVGPCGTERDPAEDDVTPNVAKLRALLAGQREQAGGES